MAWGPRPTNQTAIASFVVSLVALVLALGCGITILACPVGAVLGHKALREVEARGEQGRGLALAGVIIGWIGTALLLAGILLVGIWIVILAGA